METNVQDPQEKPSNAAAPAATPAAKPAVAAPKKKKSEAESVIDGHAESIKSAHVSDEKMRRDGRFAAFVGVVLVSLYLTLVTRRHAWDFMVAYHAAPWTVRIASLVGAFFVFGLFAPGPFYRVWMGYVAALLGFVMTRVILSVFFYVAVSPVALVMKILGKDPLRRGAHEGSYWLAREKQPAREHFERMF